MARPDQARTSTLAVLRADPDLAADLERGEAAAATRGLVAEIVRAEAGDWAPPRPPESGLGLLVVDGVIARDVLLAAIACTELLGPGDLLRPTEAGADLESVPFQVGWSVIEPATIAVLDERFAAAASRWPPVVSRLVGRSIRQSQSSAMHLAITCLKGVDLRLHTLLWHLADRFGKVEPGGVVVPLRLTHQVLAKLVRATRPSVTVALGELRQRGVVLRREDGAWLLRGEPPTDVLAADGRRDARS